MDFVVSGISPQMIDDIRNDGNHIQVNDIHFLIKTIGHLSTDQICRDRQNPHQCRDPGNLHGIHPKLLA